MTILPAGLSAADYFFVVDYASSLGFMRWRASLTQAAKKEAADPRLLALYQRIGPHLLNKIVPDLNHAAQAVAARIDGVPSNLSLFAASAKNIELPLLICAQPEKDIISGVLFRHDLPLCHPDSLVTIQGVLSQDFLSSSDGGVSLAYTKKGKGTEPALIRCLIVNGSPHRARIFCPALRISESEPAGTLNEASC